MDSDVPHHTLLLLRQDEPSNLIHLGSFQNRTFYAHKIFLPFAVSKPPASEGLLVLVGLEKVFLLRLLLFGLRVTIGFN